MLLLRPVPLFFLCLQFFLFEVSHANDSRLHSLRFTNEKGFLDFILTVEKVVPILRLSDIPKSERLKFGIPNEHAVCGEYFFVEYQEDSHTIGVLAMDMAGRYQISYLNKVYPSNSPSIKGANIPQYALITGTMIGPGHLPAVIDVAFAPYSFLISLSEECIKKRKH